MEAVVTKENVTLLPLEKAPEVWAKAVLEKIPRFKELLETERQAETAVITKNKERRYAR